MTKKPDMKILPSDATDKEIEDFVTSIRQEQADADDEDRKR